MKLYLIESEKPNLEDDIDVQAVEICPHCYALVVDYYMSEHKAALHPEYCDNEGNEIW